MRVTKLNKLTRLTVAALVDSAPARQAFDRHNEASPVDDPQAHRRDP
jgi:hypothetical protein